MHHRAGAPRAHPAGAGFTPGKRGAFTLIELLVVIAIIAILAAILFPVFAQAREKARQSACLSNEKQLGLAVMMYSQDYDETLPGAWFNNGGGGIPKGPGPEYNWLHVVTPYVKNNGVFACPSNRFNDEDYWTGVYKPASAGPFTAFMPNTYAPNNFLIADGAWKALADFQSPASAITITENKSRFRVIYASDFTAALTGGSGGNAARSRATNLSGDVSAGEGLFQAHSKMVNFIFADGHAKAHRLSATFAPNDLWSTGASAAQLKTWADNVRPEYK